MSTTLYLGDVKLSLHRAINRGVIVKAIVQDTYGPADVLELRDIAVPKVGEGDVLIRVHAAGVDPGVWHLMTGRPYALRLMGFGVRAPKQHVRGFDVAGVVEAAGTKVTRFRPGDPVFGTCEGSFAEFASTPEDKLVLKPARLSFEEAAAIPVSGVTALQALRDKGGVQAGQRVLVIGAGGGVGTFAVQLAKVSGAVVTGVCSGSKVDLVRSLGADHVIDYTREDFAAGADHYDLIVDTAGNRPLAGVRKALTHNGTLVIVGGEGGGPILGAAARSMRAQMLSPYVKHNLRGLFAAQRKEDLEWLAELAEAGKLTPVIDRTFALSEAPDALRYLELGHPRGKVVIRLGVEHRRR
jgi:NADPH:quinone reductase-like Zn-dependent oxidoreductase